MPRKLAQRMAQGSCNGSSIQMTSSGGEMSVNLSMRAWNEEYSGGLTTTVWIQAEQKQGKYFQTNCKPIHILDRSQVTFR
jgi:hypothetical protein